MTATPLPKDEVALKVAGVDVFDSDLAALPNQAQQQVLAAADAFPEDAPQPVLPTTSAADRRRVMRLVRDPSRPVGASVPDRRDRAAVRRYVHDKAAKTLSDLVQLARDGHPESDLRSAADSLTHKTTLGGRVPLLPSVMLADPATSARRARRSTRGKGRRSALAGLPSDWQVQLLRAADPRDRPWMAVLAVTGVRPGALSTTGFQARTDGDSLHLWVPGSKNCSGSRCMTILNTAPVSDALFRWVHACGGAAGMASAVGERGLTYDQMAARHAAAARRAFGRALPLTAHRQQLHADAKAAGWPAADIAAMTDKTSTRSVSVYATAQQGRRGALEPIGAVTTDWAIRPAGAAEDSVPDRDAPAAPASGSVPDTVAPAQMGPS
jgi:hypothetical protein